MKLGISIDSLSGIKGNTHHVGALDILLKIGKDSSQDFNVWIQAVTYVGTST